MPGLKRQRAKRFHGFLVQPEAEALVHAHVADLSSLIDLDAQLAQGGLIRGKTIGVDSTTLEANAAMKSIVRRDTGGSYTGYLKRLAEAEGIDAPDAAALRRMDRRRRKKMSNDVWGTRTMRRRRSRG
jgi:hypothetical protein